MEMSLDEWIAGITSLRYERDWWPDSTVFEDDDE